MDYLLPDLFDISLFYLDLDEYECICKYFNIPIKINLFYSNRIRSAMVDYISACISGNLKIVKLLCKYERLLENFCINDWMVILPIRNEQYHIYNYLIEAGYTHYKYW